MQRNHTIGKYPTLGAILKSNSLGTRVTTLMPV